MEKFTNLADFIRKRGVDGVRLPEFPILLFSEEYFVFILTCEKKTVEKLSHVVPSNLTHRMGYHYNRFKFTNTEIVEIGGIIYSISFIDTPLYGNLTLTPI